MKYTVIQFSNNEVLLATAKNGTTPLVTISYAEASEVAARCNGIIVPLKPEKKIKDLVGNNLTTAKSIMKVLNECTQDYNFSLCGEVLHNEEEASEISVYANRITFNNEIFDLVLHRANRMLDTTTAIKREGMLTTTYYLKGHGESVGVVLKIVVVK